MFKNNFGLKTSIKSQMRKLISQKQYIYIFWTHVLSINIYKYFLFFSVYYRDMYIYKFSIFFHLLHFCIFFFFLDIPNDTYDYFV